MRASSEPDLGDQVACVKREISMRESVYGRWVATGKMSQVKADAEINTMRAVLATLERVQKAERPGLFND